jgi:phosphocarrier protein FPr
MAEGELSGIPASPGIAIGPVFQYRPTLPPVEERAVADTAGEWERLQTAIAAAEQEIEAAHAQAQQQFGDDEADIFQAHLLILRDPDLLEAVEETLRAEEINVEAAWQRAITATAATYREMADAYMQARAADVEDVGNRVLRQLMDVALPSLQIDEPSILVAPDLTPSDTARLDTDKVLGICTERGGATSHSAILARALGIPAVVGLGRLLDALQSDQMLALNGRTGQIWVDPDYETLATLEAQKQAWLGEQLQAKAMGQKEAVTQDGRRLEIAANIGGPNDVAVALEYGAESIGLFRTEFLFLGRSQAPDEAEQAAVYREAAAQMNGRSLIIRTLDIGGDKPLPYIDLGPEDNPFLGWRGIRFCLDHPEIFRPQLRAILRASVDEAGERSNIKIMFPMIGSLEELRAAKTILEEIQAELREAEIPFDEEMEVGIMIEVPSAVAVADQLAAEVDFFSIGTNDLTQYVMAADRGNSRVATLAAALQPAVLRLVQQTVVAGHQADIWVGMCGELAGDALAAPVLVGLGLDELSMSAPSIPDVKSAIRDITQERAREIAIKALRLPSATAVQEFLAAQNETENA